MKSLFIFTVMLRLFRPRANLRCCCWCYKDFYSPFVPSHIHNTEFPSLHNYPWHIDHPLGYLESLSVGLSGKSESKQPRRMSQFYRLCLGCSGFQRFLRHMHLNTPNKPYLYASPFTSQQNGHDVNLCSRCIVSPFISHILCNLS